MTDQTFAATTFAPELTKKQIKKGEARLRETHLKITGQTVTLCGESIPEDGGEVTTVNAAKVERAINTGCAKCVELTHTGAEK